MKTLYHKTLFLSLFMLCVVFSSIGQVNISSVALVTSPATSCTNTRLVITGILTSSYIHNGVTFNVTGSTITVDDNYLAGIIVLPIIVPFSDTVNLGMLPSGSYTVTTNGRLNGAVNSTVVTPLTVISCCPAQPSFTMADTSICPGGSTSLTNTSVGATNQWWYQNNVFLTNSINYNTAVLNTPGSYVYKLVVTDGTCKDSVEKTLVVQPFPIIDLGNDTAICDGKSIIFDAGTGRDSVRWSTSVKTRTINVNTPGKYWVEVFRKGCSGSDTITLGGLANPVVNLGPDTVICDDDSIILNAALAGASYVWSTGSMNSTYVASDSGIYWVQVTATNGCMARDTVEVSLKDCSSTGIQTYGMENFELYPNPAKEQINIRLPKSADRLAIHIQLFDMQGRRLAYHVAYDATSVISYEIPSVTAGTYVLVIKDAQHNKWTRVFSVKE